MHCDKAVEVIVCRQVRVRGGRRGSGRKGRWVKGIKVDQGKGSESPEEAKHNNIWE